MNILPAMTDHAPLISLLIVVLGFNFGAKKSINMFYKKYNRLFNKAEYLKISRLILIFGLMMGLILSIPSILVYDAATVQVLPYIRWGLLSVMLLFKAGITAILAKFIFNRVLARMYYRS